MSSSAVESSRMADWLAEKASFERLLPELEAKYRGRYVAIQSGRVLAAHANRDALFERLWKKRQGRTFFIGRVGGPAPVVDMPGFEVEHEAP